MNRLYRSETDKIIGGVCGGLGKHLKIDPLILRIAFVFLAIIGNGVGVITYLIFWALMPVERMSDLDQEEVMRQNISEIGQRAKQLGADAKQALGRGWPEAWSDRRGNGMLLGGILLVSIGLVVLLGNLGVFGWLHIGKLWPLMIIALGVVVLLNNLKEKR